MKQFIGRMLIVFGTAFGLYVGGWLLLLSPLQQIVDATLLNTITIQIIVFGVLKILFAIPAGITITYIFLVLGSYLCLRG